MVVVISMYKCFVEWSFVAPRFAEIVFGFLAGLSLGLFCCAAEGDVDAIDERKILVGFSGP